MRTFSTSVTIAAPAPRVWEILADVERWPQWTPTIVRTTRLAASPLGVGSRVRVEQPKLRPALWTITAWQPEVGFSWVSRSPGVVATALHAIETTAGGTRVTLTVQFGGPLATLIGLLFGTLTQKYLGLEAASLKARSERVD